MKKIFIILIIIINLTVISRLFFLMVINKDYYQNILNIKEDFIIEGMTAPRGRILDVNGHILVDNVGVKSIIYNKLNISNKKELVVITVLAEHLELDFKINDYHLRYYFYQINRTLVDNRVDDKTKKKYNERRISNHELLEIKLALITDEELKNICHKCAYLYYLMNKGYAYQDKIIKTNITNEEYELINSLNLEGIRTDITWERIYPYGKVLKEIFGSVSTYNQGLTMELKDEYLKKGYHLNDRVGISNLEYIYDEYLKGEKAQYKINNNQLTKIQDYQKGKDLVLSIDIEKQIAIEKILEKEIVNAKKAPNTRYYEGSFIVVSNPNDGSIIALVGKKIGKNGEFIDTAYQNVLNSYTVGSVVKGASIMVGYQNKLINEKTRVFDSCIQLAFQKPKCSWSSLGWLDDMEALRVSSNYFQFLIAVKLTGNRHQANLKLNANLNHFNEYRDIFSSFGLGSKTGIDLSNEVIGMKGSTVSDDLLLNLSIGQYDTYTPISLSQYINTIATGQRIGLSLLKEVVNHDGSIYYKPEKEVLNKIDINHKYLKRVREGFRRVNANGMAYSFTNQQFTSAGKTGTAESFHHGVSTYTSSYAMYAPFEKPEISIAIVSPHIGFNNNGNHYRYPINQKVVREISSLLMNN